MLLFFIIIDHFVYSMKLLLLTDNAKVLFCIYLVILLLRFINKEKRTVSDLIAYVALYLSSVPICL